jgi:hypothetical protein
MLIWLILVCQSVIWMKILQQLSSRMLMIRAQDVDSRRAWINKVDMARIQLPLLTKTLSVLEIYVLSGG